jgi:hypothetical protein
MAGKNDEGNSLVSPIIIGVLIAVIPAVLGYIFSSFDSLRRERLEFTNNQIESLYGPLYALTQASDVAWKEFEAANWPVSPETRRYFFDRHQPRRWRKQHNGVIGWKQSFSLSICALKVS